MVYDTTYVIYEMIAPDILIRKEMVDHYLETYYQYVLEEINVHGVNSKHKSMEDACSHIKTNSKKLTNKKLTILPVFDIDYEGKIETIK